MDRRTARLAALCIGGALALSACRHRAPPIAPSALETSPLAIVATAVEPRPIEVPIVATPTATCARVEVDPPTSEVSEIDVPVPPIVDATGRVMAPFYERLARLLRGGARDHVRIAVYGDSNMTMDFITGEMRRVLQEKYGDAGHGFIALGKPWSHYRHMDVLQRVHAGFTSYAVTTNPIGDGGYGHSGIVAESSLLGAITEISTAGDSSPIGRAVSRFDLFFLERPRCGSFDVRIDGDVRTSIDCTAPDVSLGHYRADVPDGPHRIEVVVSAARRGPVRMLGAALERETPGIVVDSLGVGAMNTRSLAHELPSLSEPMLRIRRYDLVVFMVGTNDVFDRAKVPMWLKRVIDVHRDALPGVPILLVSPPDRGKLKSFEPTVAVGAQRRELAAEYQTAFWDLWGAMGGRGSMARFRRRRLSNADYIHFTAKGGAWVGDRLLFAVFRDFKAYLAEHESAGCGDDRAPEDHEDAASAASIARASAATPEQRMGQAR